jgi:hypothetical protein
MPFKQQLPQLRHGERAQMELSTASTCTTMQATLYVFLRRMRRPKAPSPVPVRHGSRTGFDGRSPAQRLKPLLEDNA